MRRELIFDAAADPSQVFTALSSHYRVRSDPAAIHRWTCLDTADWRLHRAGMTLRDARHGRDGELILWTGEQHRLVAPSRPRSWPRRIEALPESPVRERIAPVVGVRALLALADVEARSIPLSVLDDEDKTRVRVRVDQQRLVGTSQAPLPLRVLITPLRGYERDARRCAELLAGAMTEVPGHLGTATVAMAAAGHTPGEPAVADLRLDASGPAVESLVQVLGYWLDVADAVQAGVLDDVDPEYLHDFRAAVRATRSMLKLGGDLLPCAGVTAFAEEFSWLGTLSNAVRDLDVHLVRLADPGEVASLDDAALDPVRTHLATQRRAALRALRAGLRSERGTGLSRDWRAALERIEVPAVATPTAADFAAARAHAAYERVRTAARAAGAQAPSTDLHRLRRRCKQLRYLLDSYESVLDPRHAAPLRARVKKALSCLGDIQDADVQYRQLTDLADALARRGTPAQTLLAIGALRERARLREADARDSLPRSLARLTGKQTRADVAALAGQGS